MAVSTCLAHSIFFHLHILPGISLYFTSGTRLVKHDTLRTLSAAAAVISFQVNIPFIAIFESRIHVSI